MSNLICLEHYRWTRKIILYEPKHSNDNSVTFQGNSRYFFSKTGEQLILGERGELVIVDSYDRCSCGDF